jgi:hypothetical protein
MAFGGPAPLIAFGLQARGDHHSPLQAIELIVGETRAGRYPLACLFAGTGNGSRRWHVFLCARHRSKLLLIDPAHGKVSASGRAPIKLLLVRTILATPDRKGIHIMTSRPSTPNRPLG